MNRDELAACFMSDMLRAQSGCKRSWWGFFCDIFCISPVIGWGRSHQPDETQLAIRAFAFADAFLAARNRA